jgi:uncharacterized membrane protein (DUF106 family)
MVKSIIILVSAIYITAVLCYILKKVYDDKEKIEKLLNLIGKYEDIVRIYEKKIEHLEEALNQLKKNEGL